jgi:hypothetical protein
MEKQGLIRLGTGKLPKGFWKIPRPEDSKSLVLKALLEERESDDEILGLNGDYSFTPER